MDDAAEITRLTSRFADARLEAAYLAESFPRSTQPFTRFSVAITSVAFLAYGVHDLVVIPEVHEEAWAIRYGIFAPVAAALALLMGSRFYARLHQAAMLVFGLSVNAVVLWIGAISVTPAGFFLYTSFAFTFVTLGPFIARMRVVTQVAYTLLSVALYDVIDLALTHGTLGVRVSVNLTLLALGSIGALVAWVQEREARRSFLQKRALDAEKKKTDALLLNILPAKIAERLKAESRPIADGFAEVTVLFSDIVGFTKMSARLTPDELVRRLNLIFSRFDDLADELHLEKIKTIGDAYMVAGGLSEGDGGAPAVAEMALRMQVEVAALAATLGDDLQIRIGIHTGPVVGGVIGKKKFVYDVWGDTVNTASRMESHAEVGTIQVTEETYARLCGEYRLEGRGRIDVKGMGARKTWVLLGRR